MANKTIDILKKDLLQKKDQKDSYQLEASVIGVYFSAHWCPPCRGFTPELVKFYNNFIEAGKSLEIVFVSSDRDEDSFNEYYNEMPWAALKYKCRAEKDELSKLNGVKGIPTLIFFNKDGEVIDASGRSTVASNDGKTYTFDK